MGREDCKHCDKPIFVHEKWRICPANRARIHARHCQYCDHCGPMGEDGIYECLAGLLKDIHQLENSLQGKQTICRFSKEWGDKSRFARASREAEELQDEIAELKRQYKEKQKKVTGTAQV